MKSFPAFARYDIHNFKTNTNNVLMQQSLSKITITYMLFCGKHYYEVICMLFSNVYRMKRGFSQETYLSNIAKIIMTYYYKIFLPHPRCV